MDTIRCPHCGGQTRNFSVCDYCGSIIAPATNEELTEESKNKEIDKLRDAIQQNLNEQINCQSRNHVTTVITAGKNTISIINPTATTDYVQIDSNTAVYPRNPFNYVNKYSLVLRIILQDSELEKTELAEDAGSVNRRIDAKEKLEWFNHSGVANLFTKSNVAEHSEEKDTDCSSKYHAYFLDCGRDGVETARIIAQYLLGTVAISENEQIEYKQSSVPDDLYKSRLIRQSKSEKTLKIQYSFIYIALLLVASLVICINAEKIKNGDLNKWPIWGFGFFVISSFMLIRTSIYTIKHYLSTTKLYKDNKMLLGAIFCIAIVLIGLVSIVVSFIGNSNSGYSLSPI